MNEDIVDISIEADGTIKSTTPKISGANHASAAEFFRQLARMTGGTTTVSKRTKTTATNVTQQNEIKGGQ